MSENTENQDVRAAEQTQGPRTTGSSGHTPGPWSFDHDWYALPTIFAADGKTRIAIVEKDGRNRWTPAQAANARLIAAAPELKAFAERILVYVDDTAPGFIWLRVGSHPACAFREGTAEAAAILNLEAHRRAVLSAAVGDRSGAPAQQVSPEPKAEGRTAQTSEVKG